VLEAMIAEGRNIGAHERMAAYDELAGVLQATRRNKEALALLQEAMSVSPGTLARARTVTRLAASEGELELAEKTVRQLVAQHKHSPVKEANDYLMKAMILSSTGKAAEALAAVKEARASFGTEQDAQILSVAEASAHLALGDKGSAAQALKDVPAEAAGTLAPEVAAALGRSLYLTGDNEAAEQLLRQMVQNNPDDPQVIQSVHEVMSAAGKKEDAQHLVDASIREVIEINNEGVRLAYAGELETAVEKLTQAAERLPGNMQIVSNAALVLALSVAKGRSERGRMAACLKYRQRVVERDPIYPKLAQIDSLLKQAGAVKDDAASRSP
jgi:tetratricopeptide (TPR) repeat protein